MGRTHAEREMSQGNAQTEVRALAALDESGGFVCPGSTVAISRSVHLSRLRRGYDECAACPHRTAIGNLRPAKLRPSSTDEAAASWLRSSGVRATYLNELTRPVMSRLTKAIAAMLWDDLAGLERQPGQHCPVVVVGRDSRPMSPDLSAGAVVGLRRMGCHVIDVGELTRPEFWFATRHLEAFAGLWINGVGADANCGGFDVIQGGRCWSAPGRLQEFWQRRDINVACPANRKGTFATFQTARVYLASLRKHFHAFRPLTILFASGERQLQNYLQSLLEESPITTLWEHYRRLTEDGDNEQSASKVIQERLYSHRFDAVIAIDEDGQTCRFWDERGRPISPIQLLRPFMELVQRRRHSQMFRQTAAAAAAVSGNKSHVAPSWLRARTAFVRSHGTEGQVRQTTEQPERNPSSQPMENLLEHSHDPPPIILGDQIVSETAQMGFAAAPGGTTLESMSQAMQVHQARLGLDSRGAFWFDESGPTSDALLTVARILQWLSSSDAPLSQLWCESDTRRNSSDAMTSHVP